MKLKQRAQTRKNKPYIFQVSTKPDISSYKWVGKKWSLLSTAMLWTLWFCRVLSLYQHVKAIYRILGEKLGFGEIDNKSGRPNIPPMLGEIYFIIWTVFFVILYFFNYESWVFDVLAGYYLFESSVWILYYTIFRRFFEIGYSIYHELEYLTQLCLLIPTQALCLARIYSTNFLDMLKGLLGAGSEENPIIVTIMGCLLSAIVISMIISTFPVESIKKKPKNPHTFIIGCGNVVKQRVYPAIVNIDSAESVSVYDIKTNVHEEEFCKYLKSDDEICAEIDGQLEENSVVWIETPTYKHISYLKHFVDSKAKLIVVEKPIAIDKNELDFVEMLDKKASNRNRVFFLSYYILEKALPLYYLTEGNSLFEKYLNIEDGAIIQNWRFLLGILTRVKVHICEGKDTRAWVNSREYGGQLMETFVHNVLIASLFCGQPEEWSNVEYRENNEKETQEIFLNAQCRRANIDLYLKKNARQEELKRYAFLEFEGGTVNMDLDNQCAKIYFKTLDKYSEISVKPSFDKKYSVLVDMVKRVTTEECFSFEIDGLKNQIPVIRWLMGFIK